MKHVKKKALKEEVQHLCVEIIRKNELVNRLETEVYDLKHQCQCQICYISPPVLSTVLMIDLNIFKMWYHNF